MDKRISPKDVEKARQDFLRSEQMLRLTDEEKENMFGRGTMENDNLFKKVVNSGIKSMYESDKHKYEDLSRRLRSGSFRIPRRKTASRRVARKSTKSQYAKSRKTTKKTSASPKRRKMTSASPKRRKTTSRK